MKRAITIAAMLAAAGLAGAQMFAQLFGGETWTPAALGPVAWYKAENNALDSAGANNGTWHGTSTYATGKIGRGFGFNGSSYVSGLASINASLPFTISAWVNPTNTSEIIVGSSNGAGFRLVLMRPTFTIAGIGNASTAEALPFNKMVHVCLVRNDITNLVLYVDSVATPKTLIGGGNISCGIGGNNGRYFHGTIDDVLIFNRALTADEIKKIYDESVLKNGAAW